jgi:hypothetical protein
MTFTYMLWLHKSEEAYKRSVPKGPCGATVPVKQRKVQNLLQLIYANKALSGMRVVDITSDASWNKAQKLKMWALFARKAMASQWPKL